MEFPVRKSWATVGLATPHMTDKQWHGEVSEAQHLLTHNAFGEDFHPGVVDGEFGILTAHATKRAKFYLGFPKNPLKYHFAYMFGPELRSFLLPEHHPQHAKLPRSYRARRKLRLAARRLRRRRANRIQARRHRVVAIAHSQIGTHEYPPYSNRVKYAYWYGFIGSWCAMFVSWCNAQVRIRPFQRGRYYAYCPFILDDARAQRNGLRLVSRYEVEAGDTVLYDWPNESPGTPDHTEVFVRWNVKYESFYAIGGNTTNAATGNPSDGGGVWENLRYVSVVQAFVRAGN